MVKVSNDTIKIVFILLVSMVYYFINLINIAAPITKNTIPTVIWYCIDVIRTINAKTNTKITN